MKYIIKLNLVYKGLYNVYESFKMYIILPLVEICWNYYMNVSLADVGRHDSVLKYNIRYCALI